MLWFLVSGGGQRWVSGGNKLTQITLNFHQMISTSHEKILYDRNHLFAELGGYTGMVIGYSLMTLTDKLFYLIRAGQLKNSRTTVS